MEKINDKSVIIGLFDSNQTNYDKDYAVVAVDVIRATTTAVTGVALGRQCFPVASIEEALSLARNLSNPLLMGEQDGKMPHGFELQNSPAQLESRTDINRAMILLSSSGTRLITKFRHHTPLYVACLRNLRAVVQRLLAHHPKVALVGAGTRGEFREEDQLCCAWIAEELIVKGYRPENELTTKIVERWSGAPVDSIREGNSAAYLRKSGQTKDLDFILSHVDDLNSVYQFKNSQIIDVALEAESA